MNDERRARLRAVHLKLQDIRTELEEVRFDEENSLANLPDSFQNGKQGEKMQSAVDCLDSIGTEIDSAIDELEPMIGD